MSHKCMICGKKMGNSVNLTHKICSSCLYKMPIVYKNIVIENTKTLAIFLYNDYMKQLIYRIKACYDKDLASCMLLPCKDFLRLKYLDYILIPMPSSDSSNKKRGFNHVFEIFKVLDLPICSCFYKDNNYKQSSSNKIERTNVKKHIFLRENSLKTDKKYLLVDDITTTNQTIKTAIKILKENGIKNIKVLLLCIKERK